MRPTVFGKQIVSRNGILCGVNIGYNFYLEHERETRELLNRINNGSIAINNISDKLSFDNKRKIAIRKSNIFNTTPFSRCIILSNVDYIRREVIIDNSELKKSGKYQNFMLENTDYTLFIFSDYDTLKWYRGRLGNNRKFSESDFLYMGDYNSDISSNVGARLAGVGTLHSEIGIGTMSTMVSGAWGNDGFLVLIKRHGITEYLADNIESNLKNGGLALVNEPCGIFRDRGLGLVFLNNIYNNGKENKGKRLGLWR